MQGFKFSKLHVPVHKVKVKRTHYRVCLIMASGAIFVAHYYVPEYELHIAFATNLMFALDPTV